MKTIVHLLGITPDEVGEHICRQLAEIYPEGELRRGSYSRFLCKLPADDLRMQELLRILGQGVRPWNGFRKRQPGEFLMRLERVYGSADYEAASYFVPKPLIKVMAYDIRSGEGDLELKRRTVSLASQIGWVGWAFVVISDALKQQMDQEDLEHVLFRRVQSSGRTPYRFHDHIWELTSDFFMPSLSPQCRVLNNDGELFDGDYDKGCFLKEDHYQEPELHYLAADLQVTGKFDLALTKERFGNGDPVAHHLLVASKRFYRFCVARKLKMRWIPVRVDSLQEVTK